jgi:hypothetical protein
MTNWFRIDNIPGFDELPISRHAAEILNEADITDAEQVLAAVAKATIFATTALEGKINGLMIALGVTEGGVRPGEYDGARDLPTE